MVETNHLSWTADTGDARQEAGGPTFAALLLLIREHFIINLLRLHHTLGIQFIVTGAPKKTGGTNKTDIFINKYSVTITDFTLRRGSTVIVRGLTVT